ncbi:MAG: hypothetical protein P4K93_16235 [Terracidiphilus sp.]|nr:hypothetical protein [Terracidiphilus sp.]
MRSSSPARRRLPIDRTVQFELPFVVESAVPNPALETDLECETLSQGSVAGAPPSRAGEKASSALNLLTEDSKLSPPYDSRRKSRKRKPPEKATVPVDNKLLVSREQAAGMLSISVRGVDYYIATKRLSTRRIANRVLIPIEEIRKFARSDHPERMAG